MREATLYVRKMKFVYGGSYKLWAYVLVKIKVVFVPVPDSSTMKKGESLGKNKHI